MHFNVKLKVILLFLGLALTFQLESMSYLGMLSTNAISMYGYFFALWNSYLPKANTVKFPRTPIYTSQTAAHLENNCVVLECGLMKKFLNNPELRKVWEEVTSKEFELHEDYYTFVHAQQKIYYWPEKLYTALWQIKHKQPLDNFFFAHVKPEKSGPDAFMDYEVQRTFLLNNKDCTDKQAVYKNLLFMNYALFANEGWAGNNSAYLLSNNFNWNHANVSISPEYVFSLFGYERTFEKNKKEINELWHAFKSISDFGNILLIAVPKKEIHNYVFLCDDYGRKKSIYIKGLGLTDDIRIIMDTLLRTPEKISSSDLVQFALVMLHHNGGLDPKTGIKVFPIIAGNKEKLQSFSLREKELLKKIEVDIKNENFLPLLTNIGLGKEIERIARIYKHIFPDN